MFETLEIKTSEKFQMFEILDLLKELVTKHELRYGIMTIHVPHTTAALTLNKNFDPEVQSDIIESMRTLVPKDANYKHIEGNSDAHIKASLFGNTETLIIENGRIELGMFQSVFLCEFDGPRKRRINVKLIKDK